MISQFPGVFDKLFLLDEDREAFDQIYFYSVPELEVLVDKEWLYDEVLVVERGSESSERGSF
ncbi:hypothetical protein Lalb_Chr10g0095011 [Lupinus albus]|uniref:Uncharacterized protein n=1 Tax=Lupinus albus TaxID=3870 RepID=A0A6A4PUR5_LUPAL|nr:hypothetical protein Lalb_Chr10g0095011 [Lupinus albus]